MSNHSLNIIRSFKAIALMSIMALLAVFAAGAHSTSAAPAPGKLNLTVTSNTAGLSGNIAGANVAVLTSGGAAVAKGVTNSQGFFTGYVAPGSYTLKVTANGYQEYTQPIKFESGKATNVRAFLQRATTVDPTPTPAPVATGDLVVQIENVLLWGADVRAKVRIYADDSTVPVAEGETNANGAFAAKLPQGAYTIIVTAEGFAPAKQEAKVAAGQTTDVKVTLMTNSTVD